MKRVELIGTILTKSQKAGTRKTHKVLGDIFYKSSTGKWFFNMLKIRQLSNKELKEFADKL